MPPSTYPSTANAFLRHSLYTSSTRSSGASSCLFRLLLCAVLFTLTGCGGGSNGSGESPGAIQRVRILHLLPAVGLLDISLDKQSTLDPVNVLTLNNINYLESTGYFSLENAAGRTIFTAERAEDSSRVIQEDLQLFESRLSVYVAGPASAPTLFTSNDNFIIPDEGIARIRFLNASSVNNALDFYITPTGTRELGPSPTSSTLFFTQSSNYVELLTGRYRIRATRAGTREIIVDSGEVLLSSRSVTTALAVESTQGGTPLGLLLIPDQQ